MSGSRRSAFLSRLGRACSVGVCWARGRRCCCGEGRRGFNNGGAGGAGTEWALRAKRIVPGLCCVEAVCCVLCGVL